MVTQTLVPTHTTVTVEIPKEYLNRKLIVEIRPAEDDEERRRQELHDFLMQHQVDLSGFKFNRDELYDR